MWHALRCSMHTCLLQDNAEARQRAGPHEHDAEEGEWGTGLYPAGAPPGTAKLLSSDYDWMADGVKSKTTVPVQELPEPPPLLKRSKWVAGQAFCLSDPYQ